MTDEGHLLTAKEVADRLRIAPRTVYGLAGLVRTELTGRGRRPIVRWMEEDVARYARECRRTGQESAA